MATKKSVVVMYRWRILLVLVAACVARSRAFGQGVIAGINAPEVTISLPAGGPFIGASGFGGSGTRDVWQQQVGGGVFTGANQLVQMDWFLSDFGTYAVGSTRVGRGWTSGTGTLSSTYVAGQYGTVTFSYERGSDHCSISSPNGTWDVYLDTTFGHTSGFRGIALGSATWSPIFLGGTSNTGTIMLVDYQSVQVATTLPATLPTTDPTLLENFRENFMGLGTLAGDEYNAAPGDERFPRVEDVPTDWVPASSDEAKGAIAGLLEDMVGSSAMEVTTSGLHTVDGLNVVFDSWGHVMADAGWMSLFNWVRPLLDGLLILSSFLAGWRLLMWGIGWRDASVASPPIYSTDGGV